MLSEANDPKSEFYFSVEHACDFLAFWERLPVGDNWQRIDYPEKEPWQVWWGCAVYGFRRHTTANRWVEWVYFEIPRKSDKSGSAAAVALYDLCCGGIVEPLVLIGAGSEKQAEKVYKPIRRIIAAEPDLREDFRIEDNMSVIRCHKNGGWIEKIATIAKNEDGWNPNTVILDELHAQKPDVYEVLISALGARSNQLAFQITTAGRHASGLAWENRLRAVRILEGKEDAPRAFCMIYTVDEEDRENQASLLTDERIWRKVNPMYGISIDPLSVKSAAQAAIHSPNDREEFLRTRLNVWSNAATGLIDPQAWADCRDSNLSIEQFVGGDIPCYIGVDLSIHRDLTAIGLMFDLGAIVAVFAKFFLPEMSPTLTSPRLHSAMMDWRERGHLVVNPGGTVDLRSVERELRTYCGVFGVRYIAFDAAFGGYLMQSLWEDGLPVVDYPNKPWAMTVPTDDLLGKIHAKQLIHDDNGLLGWTMINVVGDYRTDGSVMPKKDTKNSELKIDGFVALAMANGVRINPDGGKPLGEKKLVDPFIARGGRMLGYEEANG